MIEGFTNQMFLSFSVDRTSSEWIDNIIPHTFILIMESLFKSSRFDSSQSNSPDLSYNMAMVNWSL